MSLPRQWERLADLVRFILAPAVAKREPPPFEKAAGAVRDALDLDQPVSPDSPPRRILAARQLAAELRMITSEARVLATVGRAVVTTKEEHPADLPPSADELLAGNFDEMIIHLDQLAWIAERAASNRQMEDSLWAWVRRQREPEN